MSPAHQARGTERRLPWPLLYRPRQCCRCNKASKCLRCACVKKGAPCSGCLPGDIGNCQNSQLCGFSNHAPSTVSVECTPPLRSGSPVPATTHVPIPETASWLPPTPQTCNYSLSPLPALTTIIQSHIPTLQQVPKGASDHWAKALSDCLSAVVNDPTDLPVVPEPSC